MRIFLLNWFRKKNKRKRTKENDDRKAIKRGVNFQLMSSMTFSFSSHSDEICVYTVSIKVVVIFMNIRSLFSGTSNNGQGKR